MKHKLNVVILLVVLFLGAHLIGLFVVNNYIVSDLPLGIEKPQFKEEISYIPIIIAILIATVLALVLIKFKAMKIWKVWFFFGVFLTMTISFAVFVSQMFALILALILAYLKIFRPNVYVHNFTELFIYGGLAAIFVPVLNVWSISVLLIAIAVYDMIAVWKTKHMIKMAKFQSKTKMFAGLLVPYGPLKKIDKVKKVKKLGRVVKIMQKEAILGGGDIGFPLLFSGVILKTVGFIPALIVSLFAALSLFGLFMIAKKTKFYPAMPFLAAGCFVGYFVVRLLF